MENNIKYIDFLWLKGKRKILDEERKIISDNNLSKNKKDNEYYLELTSAINKIDTYLESQKETINEYLLLDIKNTKRIISDYIRVYENKEYNEKHFLDYAIPFSKSKLNVYRAEREELIDLKNDKHRELILKNPKDLELYQHLTDTIEIINNFLIMIGDLAKSEMLSLVDEVNERVSNLQKTI